MKAARLYGPRDVRIEEIEEPEPGPRELKIKVAWNALSASDLQRFLSPGIKFKAWPSTLGHEFSGTIAGVGRGIDTREWEVGMNVVVDPLVSCMVTTKCSACASGHRNRCPKVSFIGNSADRRGGGLAEYVTVDVQHVHKIPESMPLEVAACIGPIAVAWHAVARSSFNEGDTALILGGGPVAFFILRVLRSIAPKSFILMSEASATRRMAALKHGASDVLDPLHTHFGAAGVIHKATAGFGVHAVFDTVGTQSTVDSALLCLRTGGTLVNMALWKQNVTMNMNFLFKEITVTGAMAYNNVHPDIIEAIAQGGIHGIEELITDKIQIEDVKEKGFLELLNHGDKHIKILVKPTQPPKEEDPAEVDEENTEDKSEEEIQGVVDNKSASPPVTSVNQDPAPIIGQVNASAATKSLARIKTHDLSPKKTRFVEGVE